MEAKTVEIELGGKIRTLKYDLNALRQAEIACGGISPLMDPERLFKTPSMLRSFVWAGLLHEDNELTEEQVGSWIHLGNMREIDEKIATLFPKVDEQEKKE